MSNIVHCNQILDIPVGHAVVDFGPVVMDRKGNRKEGWIFAIGYSENYHEPGTRIPKEECEDREAYILGIRLQTPEQADVYAKHFAMMAEEMRTETISEAEDSNESL